ncbi:hypothetical protein N0O92_01470 [Alkalihalobacillus sp. MEB130]|uniref:hypothetical protein n=1 Tax=Alkalihalobacillus sp. MEB130 TaxID=2976704 RepID=UPI0028DE9EFC|nr:hypothetical protein [Alkalihalobacillus sp. MEB130]MDT8858880.1 hypothetical protein [Alkalihalobacillus sp. MEB130]
MLKLFKIFKTSYTKEQDMCERRLVRIMKRLNVAYFDYNWDRHSCYIEFRYKETMYKMEHSSDKAKGTGVAELRSGLDCLIELVDTFEDLCHITDRGTYKLETWLSGMKKTSLVEEKSEPLEKMNIKHKLSGKQKHEEYSFVTSESSLVDFDRTKVIQRTKSK